LPKFGNNLLCDFASLGQKKAVQARFLLGPAGSGKTFRCLAEIRAALAAAPEGPPLILLAPKQATFQLERQLLADSALTGYTRLNIFSFERLARFVLESLGVPMPSGLLAEEGRVMALRALLMRHEDKLKLFHRSARRTGFAQQLSQLLGELQQHQFTPARLRALSARPDLRRELQDKLHDLALLFEAYTNWLAEHELQDGNRLLDAATESLKSRVQIPKSAGKTGASPSSILHPPASLQISSLWLDGFAEMTPQELDLLAAILPRCDRATLAFCLASEPAADTSWLSIWSSIGQTFQQCRQRLAHAPECDVSVEILPREPGKNRFPENSALAALENGWAWPVHASERRPPARHEEVGVQASACVPADRLKPELQCAGPEAGAPAGAISLAAYANPEAEAVFAAREILKFVHDDRAGNRFRDAAVLVRSLDGYHKPLERAFRRYGIPFFLDRREFMAHHPLAELTRSALRTVAFDWPHDDWFAALKAGFSPVDEAEIDRLENEALARGWHGAKWREPFSIADNPELEKFLERLREKMLPPFQNLAAQFARWRNKPTGTQLAETLRKFWFEMKVEPTLERWSLATAEQSSVVNRQSSIHLTVWEQMKAWLDNVTLAFADEALALRDWLPILEAGLANLTAGVIPPALDQVLIGAIDRARNPDLKLALVLGVNESVFPAALGAPVILTDADRDEIRQRAAAPGPNLRERLARERFLGYIACTRASEKLVVTFSRHDADGRALNPSPFIAHLRRIVPGLDIEESSSEVKLDEAEHVSEIASSLMTVQSSEPERRSPARREEVGVQASVCASADRLKPELHHAVPEAGAPSHETVKNWDELLELPVLAELVKRLRALREPDPAEGLSPALAEKLFGPTLHSSVSRLEEFAQCPFRFFVHSGLRAEERKKFELDAREQGSFQHEALKMFHEQLSAEGKRWRDLTPAEARVRIGKIAAALALDYRDGLLHTDEQSRFIARVLGESLQDFVETLVTWMCGQYEFDPAVAELEFGIGAGGAPAWEIDWGTGHKLALRGRIDRIDLGRETDGRALCVVMDYKSGQKKLDKILVEHGVQLQLLAYLAAIRSWPPKVWAGLSRPAFFPLSSPEEERVGVRSPIVSKTNPLAPALSPFGRGEGAEPKNSGALNISPAGVFYVNLHGQYESGGTRDEALSDAAGARRRAYRHAGRFDAGALSRLDRTQAADQFNYRLNKDGGVRSNSVEALPRAEFEALLDRVETQFQKMGRTIFSGAAQVDPYRKGHETPCEYCDFRAACRIDPWTHRYRGLRPAAEKAFDNSHTP
jgi:ATP-dependent helicase/nuclease subunit B